MSSESRSSSSSATFRSQSGVPRQSLIPLVLQNTGPCARVKTACQYTQNMTARLCRQNLPNYQYSCVQHLFQKSAHLNSTKWLTPIAYIHCTHLYVLASVPTITAFSAWPHLPCAVWACAGSGAGWRAGRAAPLE